MKQFRYILFYLKYFCLFESLFVSSERTKFKTLLFFRYEKRTNFDLLCKSVVSEEPRVASTFLLLPFLQVDLRVFLLLPFPLVLLPLQVRFSLVFFFFLSTRQLVLERDTYSLDIDNCYLKFLFSFKKCN